MSPSRPHPLAALPVVVLFTVAACGDPDRPSGTDSATTPEPLTEARRSALVDRGASAAGGLQAALGSTLQERIRADGIVGAVAFCNLEAPALTDSVTRELGVRVARTSDRVRNPANAPDPVDRRALGVFQDTRAGEVSHHLELMGDSTVRYYQPLYAAELCTRCHGPAESLDPELRAVLAERYPRDQATGYRVGDVRGLIRVTLPRYPEAAGSGS